MLKDVEKLISMAARPEMYASTKEGFYISVINALENIGLEQRKWSKVRAACFGPGSAASPEVLRETPDQYWSHQVISSAMFEVEHAFRELTKIF